MADLTITAASVVGGAGAVVANGTLAGVTTAGQMVYKDANGKYALADADSVTAAQRVPAGIALNGGAADQRVAVQTGGDVTIGATLVAGTFYYVSDTPGAICPLADLETGDYIVQVGYAVSTTVLRINIVATGVATA